MPARLEMRGWMGGFLDRRFSFRMVRNFVIVAVSHFAFWEAGHFLYSVGQSSPVVVFSPAGAALACLMIFGWRYWPAVTFAATCEMLLAGTAPVLAVLYIIGRTIEPLLGVYLLRLFDFKATLARGRDLFSLIAVALVAPIFPPIVVAVYAFANGATLSAAAQSFFYLWIASVLSVVVFGALMLRWWSRPDLDLSRMEWFEAALAFTILFASTYYETWITSTPPLGISMTYFLLLALLWIALRLRLSYTALGMVVLTLILFGGMYFGFTANYPIAQRTIGITSGELTIIVLSFLFLFVAATAEERKSARADLSKKIEDLDHALSQLRAEDQKKNEFIAVLAHELRNPLSPIANYLTLMDLEGIGDTKFAYAASGIQKNFDTIVHLIDDLLDISRINKGTVMLNIEPFDLRAACTAAAEAVWSQMAAANLSFTVELSPLPLPVSADKTRVEQVLSNLLTNALKYTDAGGSVELSCVQENGRAVLKIRDSGIGIDPSIANNIFEPFTRSKDSVTRYRGGLGIGLSISRSLVQMMRGDIAAESLGKGKGSVFTVTFPLTDAPLAPRDESAGFELMAADARKKILVIDDEADIVSSMSALLTALGFLVMSATNDTDALALARRELPDIVLMDIGMPGMGGYELARTMRRSGLRHIRLIAVTGYGQREDIENARSAGFDHHFTKPLEISALLQVIVS